MEFSLFKKPILPLFDGFVDYHSHILPGVDDGVRSFEDSKKILKEYSRLGVRKVYLTPHVMEDVPNTPEQLKQRFEELKAFLEGTEYPELHLASENMLDGLFSERLERGELLPLEGQTVLVETSYYNPPYNMEDLIFRLKSSGYTPLLAHPERYRYMEKSDYLHWRNFGVQFQMNLSSLLGFYGDSARKNAEMLLKENMYDYIGTDLHRYRVLEMYEGAKLSKGIIPYIEKLIEFVR